MLAEVDFCVSMRSIQRLLHEMGLEAASRPELLPRHATQCLAWARRYEHYTLEDWAGVKWTDECSAERGAGVQAIWTFLRPSEQLAAGDVCTRRTGKGVKQMFWAGFGQTIRTGLVPLNGDPDVDRGGVNSTHIQALYSAWLPEFVFDGDIFMHDNASVHTARIVQQLLRELGVEVMDWPSYSPDLNSIESLWAIMKQEIYKLYPDLEHAPGSADTTEQLIQAAKEAWDSIDNQILEKLSNTMSHRVKAVIEANGWYTKY
jgi:hypothetical protein